MADITHMALWVATFGLVAVLISLAFSTLATHAARQAVSGERAWIAFDTARFEWSVDYEKDGVKERRLIVELVMKNHGETPALECASCKTYALYDAEEKIPKHMLSISLDDSQTPVFTAPDKHILLGIVITEKEGQLVSNGEKCLLFHAYCEYKTTFDNKKRSQASGVKYGLTATSLLTRVLTPST